MTDHKNLQYLREAKRLNPRQARWALFFTRFQFKISYRPGPRNVKADALSRIHTPEGDSGKPEGILPAEIITSPIQWTSPPVASTTPPANPPGCPPDHQYVPRTQRTPLIHTTHTSLGTGHPGANATLSLLRDRFWWPNMARDVRRFVQGCPDCAISKCSRHLPAGKILPLPIPNCPWSHLGVDFITDLPVSDGNTCILVIIDRFSKFCHLIPLAGLPTALQTAELLFNQVVHYYGIPEDIVSDRGPQFISRVWKAFFSLLGVTVSLSSGYHPQSNGQTERKIQDVGRFLRTFCHGRQNSWNQFLGWAEYAQNSLHQSSTGLTPFQCVLGFQPPCFHGQGNHQTSPRSTTGSERARESGTQLTISYSRQCADKGWQRTSDDQLVPNINLGKRSGCPHETSSCACLAGSSVPDSLAPSPFWNRLTQSLTNFSYPHTTGFTLTSMYHYSNPSLLLFPQSLARKKSTLSLSSRTKEPSTA